MAFRGLLPRQTIASGDRPFRASTPSSPLIRSNSSSNIGASGFSIREWLIVLGVVVVLLVVMGATHQSFSQRANDLLLAARQAVMRSDRDDDASLRDGSGSVRVCAHRGMDQSNELIAAKRELRSLGWTSLSNQFRFNCHTPVANLAHMRNMSDVQRRVDRLRKRVLGSRTICCADYDVFFSTEGTVWVGRPETVALRIARQSKGEGAAASSSSSSLTEADPQVRRITTLVLSGGITDGTLDAVLGPSFEDGERLFEVATAIAESILVHQNNIEGLEKGEAPLPHLASPNIHASLELKIIDSQRSARNGIAAGRGSATVANASVHSLFRGNTRVASVLAAAALRAFQLKNNNDTSAKIAPSSADAMNAFTKRVFHSISVIVDPVFRFRSIRQLLLRKSPEYFLPYLETKPQLVFSVPLLDRPLLHNQLPENDDTMFDAKAYCSLLLHPPVWASDVMPSLRFLSWCEDVYPQLLQGPPAGTAKAQSVPINAWLVDSSEDAEFVNKLRSRAGLTQLSSVVSNFARTVNEEFVTDRRKS